MVLVANKQIGESSLNRELDTELGRILWDQPILGDAETVAECSLYPVTSNQVRGCGGSNYVTQIMTCPEQ